MFMEWWVLLRVSQLSKSYAELYRGCLPLHLTGAKLREYRSTYLRRPIFSSANILVILDLLLQRHVRWLYEQACIFFTNIYC
jgi:hypothetical protein